MDIFLANSDQVPEASGIIIPLEDGRDVALFKLDGKIWALDNSCPHMGGPLGDGEVEGCFVTCPWHGYQFDIKTGACVNVPGLDATHLKIEVRGKEIYLCES